MKKSDLKHGMIVLTTGGRYGVVVEEDATNKNCIKFLYDPRLIIGSGRVFDILSFDDIDENLNIFIYASEKDVEYFDDISIGDKVIIYQIIEVFEPHKIWQRKNLKPTCSGLMGDDES